MADTEHIICPCGKEHFLTESVICQNCGQKVKIYREVRQEILDLDRKIQTLKAEAFLLQTELWLRERRRTETTPKGNPTGQDFWKNVNGRPDWAKADRQAKGKKERELKLKINLADFD